LKSAELFYHSTSNTSSKISQVISISDGKFEVLKTLLVSLFSDTRVIKLMWGCISDLVSLVTYLYDNNFENFTNFLENLYDVQYIYDIIKISDKKDLYSSLRDVNLISLETYDKIDKIDKDIRKNFFYKGLVLDYSTIITDGIPNERSLYCLYDVLYLKDFFMLIISNFGQDMVKDININFTKSLANTYYNIKEKKYTLRDSKEKLDNYISIHKGSLKVYPPIETSYVSPLTSKQKGDKAEEHSEELANIKTKELHRLYPGKEFYIIRNLNLHGENTPRLQELGIDKNNLKMELDLVVVDKDNFVYYVFESKSVVTSVFGDSFKLINLLNYCKDKVNVSFTIKGSDDEELKFGDYTKIIYSIFDERFNEGKYYYENVPKNINQVFIGTFIGKCCEKLNPELTIKILNPGKEKNKLVEWYVLNTEAVLNSPDILKVLDETIDRINKSIDNLNTCNKEIFYNNGKGWTLLENKNINVISHENIPQFIKTQQALGTIVNYILSLKYPDDPKAKGSRSKRPNKITNEFKIDLLYEYKDKVYIPVEDVEKLVNNSK
jgi:hypothetical protein